MLEERFLNSFKNKKAFVEDLARAIREKGQSSVADIRYEVYTPNEDSPWADEYIIMVYDGGAIAPRTVSADSPGAIFQEIAKMYFGGYYDEVQDYQEIVQKWIKVL